MEEFNFKVLVAAFSILALKITEANIELFTNSNISARKVSSFGAVKSNSAIFPQDNETKNYCL